MASQEEKEDECFTICFCQSVEKEEREASFLFFFQHHIPVLFFSLENISVLVLSSLETKELNRTEEARSRKKVWEV